VVFVRHCLPGESVLAEVTEDRGGSFCLADAVEVSEPAPDRVPPPCEYARPGGCGGCDFQHVSLTGQRALKAAVVIEQLARLAGIERDVTVEALADTGLGWRRRIRYAVAPDGQLGLRAHHSHRVVALAHCPLGAAGVGDAEVLRQRWPELAEVEVATDDRGEVATLGFAPAAEPPRARPGQRRRTSRPSLRAEQLSGPEELVYAVAGRSFRVRPAGFWQTHPRAAEVFTQCVLAATGPAEGQRVLDLYAGSGLFTAALADAVGADGQVLGLEGDPAAVEAAAANLAGTGWAAVQQGSVTAATVTAAAADLGGPEVIVLDPPRTGAGAEVLRAILAVRPRVVIYVACDPAALARDLRTAQDAGWELAELRAFDAFPMTHHVECIAVIRERVGDGGRAGRDFSDEGSGNP
jgi:tRNA/tmRNA/rRNA uracil-C5-methylase (TrmA/RlmC/RlmD family)